MVYIDLSVTTELEQSLAFYTTSLGLFYGIGEDRVVFRRGAELILDFLVAGTDEHFECFGQHDHAPSSIRVSVELEVAATEERYVADVEEIDVKFDKLLGHLKQNNVPFRETYNLGGHLLEFIDPSGNKIALSSPRKKFG